MQPTPAPISPLLIDLPERLDGARVRVRPYQPDDAQALWEAVDESRDHLSPWLAWVAKYQTMDDARMTIARAQARWLLREDLTVGIFELASGRLLGGSGLHRINWEIRAFEIGYWLRRSAEGNGYAQEAVRLLTGVAFGALGANRVEIRMHTAKTRSRQVAERLGYVFEGTLRNSMPDVNGHPYT